MTESMALIALALIALVGTIGQAVEGASRIRNRMANGMADDFWPED